MAAVAPGPPRRGLSGSRLASAGERPPGRARFGDGVGVGVGHRFTADDGDDGAGGHGKAEPDDDSDERALADQLPSQR
jgi:hypothetical protein